MTPLEKLNLMLQGGYNPMGGGINTNQMEDKKQADQRLKNQQLGNFLLAFSDTLRGVNPAQGVLQRQEIFQQQADERKAEEEFAQMYATLNDDQKRIVDLQRAGINLPTPTERKIIKGADGFNYYADTGERVLPNVIGKEKGLDKQPTSVEEFKFAQENPEFAEFLKSKKGPLVNIDSSAEKFQEESAKLAIETVKEERKNVAAGRDIDDRLIVLEKSIDNVDTGALEELKLPFKKLGAALNILPADELEQLNQQELFSSFTGFIIPRMRVVGSGATSDREIELFKSAVPTIGNTKEGNKLLIGGLRAITKYNKERLRLMENYVNKNKTIFGFEEFADAELGSLYKSFYTSNEYENLIKNEIIKEGDFVFNGVTGQFIIIDKEDIERAYE